MFTVARPTTSPALVNSVICCGSSAPSRFVSRSYQPQPGMSPKSLPKPAMLVDSARSAERADEQRPAVFLLARTALTYAPHVAERGAVGLLVAGLLPHLGRVGVGVEEPLVLEDRAVVARG